MPRCVFADLPPGYAYDFKNCHHNYHFTPTNFQLPPLPAPSANVVVLEGFAPNLN